MDGRLKLLFVAECQQLLGGNGPALFGIGVGRNGRHRFTTMRINRFDYLIQQAGVLHQDWAGELGSKDVFVAESLGRKCPYGIGRGFAEGVFHRANER